MAEPIKMVNRFVEMPIRVEEWKDGKLVKSKTVIQIMNMNPDDEDDVGEGE